MGAGGSRFVVTERVGPWIPASGARSVERTGMTVQVAPGVARPALRAGPRYFAPLALPARPFDMLRDRAGGAFAGSSAKGNVPGEGEMKEERNVL